MEIANVQQRHDFNSWFNKNHTDVTDPEQFGFYGKPDIEQAAYLKKYCEDKGVIILEQVNAAMANKFIITLYFVKEGKQLTLPKNCATPKDALSYGITKALEEIYMRDDKQPDKDGDK